MLEQLSTSASNPPPVPILNKAYQFLVLLGKQIALPSGFRCSLSFMKKNIVSHVKRIFCEPNPPWLKSKNILIAAGFPTQKEGEEGRSVVGIIKNAPRNLLMA